MGADGVDIFIRMENSDVYQRKYWTTAQIKLFILGVCPV
jgi:hypothetical protein